MVITSNAKTENNKYINSGVQKIEKPVCTCICTTI